MKRKQLRSPLGRAVGLGSAKDGVQHWWIERVTAVALTPLTLWFVISIISQTRSGYAAFVAWLKAPLPTMLMVTMLIGMFYHMALGLRVVIEDYRSSWTKFAALLATQLACFFLAVAGIVATFFIAFRG